MKAKHISDIATLLFSGETLFLFTTRGPTGWDRNGQGYAACSLKAMTIDRLGLVLSSASVQ